MENYRKFLNEPMPCDGCVHNESCAVNKRACLAFALYVDKGRDDWNLPRLPTKRTYTRVMFMQDNSLRLEINEKLKQMEVSQ
jgi:hypothetical protein